VPEILERAERAIEAGKHLIVNLSGATFIDSSTIHALFTANEAAKDAGRAFVLQFGTHASVKRVLAITGADRTLPTARTRKDAVELIRSRV
jgi:anti-anti-sigma factor